MLVLRSKGAVSLYHIVVSLDVKSKNVDSNILMGSDLKEAVFRSHTLVAVCESMVV